MAVKGLEPRYRYGMPAGFARPWEAMRLGGAPIWATEKGVSWFWIRARYHRPGSSHKAGTSKGSRTSPSRISSKNGRSRFTSGKNLLWYISSSRSFSHDPSQSIPVDGAPMNVSRTISWSSKISASKSFARKSSMRGCLNIPHSSRNSGARSLPPGLML